MRIAVLQGSSQKLENGLLVECTVKAVKDLGHEVINFCDFIDEEIEISYIQTAISISMHLVYNVLNDM